MNIQYLKSEVKKLVNQKHNFVYYGSRGQKEKFYGFIDSVYPRIFTVKTSTGLTKAFCYSDYAIKMLKII